MSLNTVIQDYKINKADREAKHGHKAYLLWFTGFKSFPAVEL